MDRTYLWSIAEMERNAADGGVVAAHWRVIAQDGDHTASAYGSVNFRPDPTDPDFVPFENLTEETVLGWVWLSVDKAQTEALLDGEIAHKKSPPVLTGTPWQAE